MQLALIHKIDTVTRRFDMPAAKSKGRKKTTAKKTAKRRPKRKIQGAIPSSLPAELDKEFDANPMNRLRLNACAESDPSKMVLNQTLALSIDRHFSKVLDDWGPTDQKGSGRCWIFAATNLLRVGAMKKLKLKGFEFSQNHVMYWDKFEKANYFLEAIIETAGLDIDDRTVATIFGNCVSDGGQWNMFVNVVRKYGLVPKTAMPETKGSSGTSVLNGPLVGRLRLAARQLRKMNAAGASLKELRTVKLEVLKDVHMFLRIHLGTPPSKFDWKWKDNKGKLHHEPNMTPQKFFRKYVTLPLDDYVCLVHDPRKTSPYNRTFTVKHLGNVVDGGIVKYLNIDIDLMKKITMKTILGGEPVWFGCDCGKMMHRDMSVWDKNMFDYETFYGTTTDIEDKADRLLYKTSAMNHAMLFTGVDVVKGKPRKWRVENSWGDKGQGKGFYLMNDSWFNDYMFEIAARKSSLPVALQKAYEKPPIVLPPWDPMGSLAR